METKPKQLYHGSNNKFQDALKPILENGTPDRLHTRAAVFATERIDVASLFMFPVSTLHSIGFEEDIAYICIWGKYEDFAARKDLGYLYVLPSDTFEKVGKEYEWQSFVEVKPDEVREFDSIVDAIIQYGAQVYFIEDDFVFDKIVSDKNDRSLILQNLISENQRRNVNVKLFG
jgi:hypothetical protein